MIDVNTYQMILAENEGRLPLLTLAEFFEGNTDEYSIAPNQWEYGRPTLAKMWEKFQEIESMPEIAWVRVALHDDTEIEQTEGKEVLTLAGDTIVVCTNFKPRELESIVDCEWLASDGITKMKNSELKAYCCVPQIPEKYSCLQIWWD